VIKVTNTPSGESGYIDSGKSLRDCPHPERWIVGSAVVIDGVKVVIATAQKCHKRNARHGLPEVIDKALAFLPRGAMPDHDDSRRSIREIKIPCSARTHDRNHRVPE
jgi:hypothetical protein